MKPGVLLLSLAAVLAAADVAPRRISGVVRNRLTGAPVERVRVALMLDESTQPAVAVVTKADGRFAFDNLAPGKYALFAERRGFAPASYGQTQMGPAVAVVVAPGEKTEGLEFSIAPASAIEGRVLDDAGEPVKAALAQLMVSTIVSGRRAIRIRGYQWTDDRGLYRFPYLPAGVYHVCVSGQPWYAYRMPDAAFSPRCLGGAGDVKSSAPLRLGSGEEQEANFTLTLARGVTVTITAPTDRSYILHLVREGPGAPEWHIQTANVQRIARLSAVPPGSYRIYSRTATGEALYQRQNVEVGGADVAVTLAPLAPLLVAGEARMDQAPAAPQVTYLRETERNRSVSRQIGPAGGFQFDGLLPTRYIFGLGGRDFYIDRIAAEGAPLEGRTLDLTQAVSPVRLKVSLRSDGGRIDGKVRRQGAPAPGALVILAPAPDSPDPADYALFVTDGDGSFDFRNRRPGAYHLFATDEPELEYANPDAIRPFRKTATAVTLEPHGRHTGDLELPARR
jgi:hypothetical protein